MTKVLWLVNPLQYSEKDIDFPAYLQKITDCSLLCVFLEDSVFESLPVFMADPLFPAVDVTVMGTVATEESTKVLEDAKNAFIQTCINKKVKVQVHDDKGNPIQEVIAESRFADSILVKSSLSFNLMDDEIPSHFVKKVLSKAECPALVMPDDHQVINQIYFTYNGGYSSVYAMKQFTYLFPGFKDLPATVLFADDNKSISAIKHEKEMREWLDVHYSEYTFKILKGDPESELLVELLDKKNIIATYGAFGRNNISRLFRRGGANKVLEIIDIPLFITHP